MQRVKRDDFLLSPKFLNKSCHQFVYCVTMTTYLQVFLSQNILFEYSLYQRY